MGAGLGLFFVWVAISLVLGVICVLKSVVVAAVWASTSMVVVWVLPSIVSVLSI